MVLGERVMIRTPICDLLNIKHPIALGGMGSASAPAMTAADGSGCALA